MSALPTLIMIILILDFIDTEEEMVCVLNYTCVPVAKCREAGDILYPCDENLTRVCCSTEEVIDPNTVEIKNRLSMFPLDCGLVSITDRIVHGEVAALGQFPWMALLGYAQKGISIIQFLCGGSLITKNYILTAAHCISIDVRLKLQVVRLGEHNLETAEDCDGNLCSTYIDFEIERVVVHEKFNNKTLENDIAVIQLRNNVNFTEYIRPICLPFDNETDHAIGAGAKLTVSGWGKTDSANLGGSSKLMYTVVTIWDQMKCNSSVPPAIRPIRESQICANGKAKQDSCKGDSGGPLVNSTLLDDDYRTYQVGIVSFASAVICGNVELPTIYTKVDYYENWIIDNVV